MIKHGPFSNVIPMLSKQQEKDRRQAEIDRGLATPESKEAARDICIHVLTEDLSLSLGVGLFPAPVDKAAWLLTPDQADELALQLVRNAAEARRWEAEGKKR